MKKLNFTSVDFAIDSDGDLEIEMTDYCEGYSGTFLNKKEQKQLLELLKKNLGEPDNE